MHPNITLYLSKQGGVLHLGRQQFQKKVGFCGQAINLSFQCEILARRVDVILECKQGILNGSREMI